MLIVLFEPDIPQNTGSMIRLSACMGVDLHIIEPCGFPMDDKRLRRVSMDYFDLATLVCHSSWQAFLEHNQVQQGARLVLLTTHAKQLYTDFTFRQGDILLFGRESSGVPQYVRDMVQASIKVPMHGTARSLNLVQAASMILGEAVRQMGYWNNGVMG